MDKKKKACSTWNNRNRRPVSKLNPKYSKNIQ